MYVLLLHWQIYVNTVTTLTSICQIVSTVINYLELFFMREPQVCIFNSKFPSLGLSACPEVMYFEREEVIMPACDVRRNNVTQF